MRNKTAQHTLTVHPKVSPRHYGFYLRGFQEAFGWRIRLAKQGFPELSDPKSGMAAILPEGQRIFIAANDHAHVDQGVVEWADVVGQVNVDPGAHVDPKVLVIGPSFGVPWPSLLGLTSFVVRAGVSTAPLHIPAMLRDYWGHQRARKPLEAYTPGESSGRELFFLASYWPNADQANQSRLRFVRAAARLQGVELHGGFWSGVPMLPEFLPYELREPVEHGDYLRRTRGSAVVFNTPAVHACLGWKLGEFLCLGKAIISTPLGRLMPGDFQSGVHYHEVDDTEDAIADALLLLMEDLPYRRMLERNARSYWDGFLAPTSVVRRIVQAAEYAAKGPS